MIPFRLLTRENSQPYPVQKNLTDYYLLALAIKNGGKLVTFDQRIDPSLLQGGISSYQVIPDNLGE
jgi:hypothetical protein